MKLSSVLLVCTGNICRSPMAHGWVAKYWPMISVQSAGVGALVGQPAQPLAVEVMASRHQVDLHTHRAQALTETLVREHDLVLVAEHLHQKHILQKYPFARGRVYRIAEHQQLDIPDPYMQGRQHYLQCLSLLEQGLQHWSRTLHLPLIAEHST